MMFVTLTLLILLFIYAIIRATKRYTFVQLLNKLPCIPNSFPLLGNLLNVPWDHKEFPKKMRYYFKHVPNDGIFTAWLGTRPFIFVFESDKVKDILQNSKHLNKTEDYKFLLPWLGTGLLTSSGGKWSKRRRLLEPVFKMQMLQKYLSVMNEESSVLVQNLGLLTHAESMDIAPQLTLCALDIICGSIMGIRIKAQEGGSSEYVKSIHRMTEIIQTRQVSLLYRWDALFKLTPLGREHDKCLRKLHKFTRKVIRDRKLELSSSDNMKKGKLRDQSFLDLLILASEEEKMTDEDVREEVDTFMFAGHDTTGSALQWAILLLSMDLNVQDNIKGELDTIFGESKRNVELNDLNQMVYLECVIKEVLRMFPPIPLFARELQCEDVIGEYRIPANTTVSVLPPMLHRDNRHFPNPDCFDPERFRNDMGRPSCSYVPFSHGKRNCIGKRFAMMELKVVLSAIFRHFTISNSKIIPPKDVEGLAEIVYRPADGVEVKIRKR